METFEAMVDDKLQEYGFMVNSVLTYLQFMQSHCHKGIPLVLAYFLNSCLSLKRTPSGYDWIRSIISSLHNTLDLPFVLKKKRNADQIYPMWFKRQDLSGGMDPLGGDGSFDSGNGDGFISSPDANGNFDSFGNNLNDSNPTFNNNNFNGNNLPPNSQPMGNPPVILSNGNTPVFRPVSAPRPIPAQRPIPFNPSSIFPPTRTALMSSPPTMTSVNTIESPVLATPSLFISSQPQETQSSENTATPTEKFDQNSKPSYNPAVNNNDTSLKYQPDSTPTPSKATHVGIAIGCTIGVLALVVLLYIAYLKKKKLSKQDSLYGYKNEAPKGINYFKPTKTWLNPNFFTTDSKISVPSTNTNDVLSCYSTDYSISSGIINDNSIFAASGLTKSYYGTNSTLTMMYNYPTDSYEAATELEHSEAMFSDRSFQSITEDTSERKAHSVSESVF